MRQAQFLGPKNMVNTARNGNLLGLMPPAKETVMRPKQLMNLFKLSPKYAVEGLKTQTVSNIMRNTFKDSWVKKSAMTKTPTSITAA